jgi:uncharacterized membrane protein YphA (DoxX/SURF4 family)
MRDFIFDSLLKESYIFYLLPLRLYVGLTFLVQGIGLTRAGFDDQTLETQLLRWVERDPSPWYASLMEGPFAEHAAALAVLVLAGHLIVGALLVLGLATRPACVVGIFMNLNFMFAKGSSFTSISDPVDAIFILIQLTLLFVGAGRSFGVDYWLSKRFRWLG